MRYIPVLEILVILAGLTTIAGRVITSLFDFDHLTYSADPSWWDDKLILYGGGAMVISLIVELITRLATTSRSEPNGINKFIFLPRIGLFLAGLIVIVVVGSWLRNDPGPSIGGGAIYILGAMLLVSGIGLLTRYPFIKAKATKV